MRITILNRIRPEKVRYIEVIDHARHDVFYVDAPFTFEKVARTKPDHIIALSEYDLLTAAELRENLSLPGPNLEATLLVRDKILMKEAVRNAGILCPRSSRLNKLTSLNGFKFPIVMKPIDGASSEGVEIIPNRDTFFKRISAMSEKERANYEIEDYISGPIFHFDGWVQNGQVMDFIPSRYVGTCYDFLNGLPLGSYQIDDDDGSMRIWSEKVARSVGINSGPFHLEAIQSGHCLYFLEIAHRVGGAGVGLTFEMKTGVNLYQAHLATQLGLRFEKGRGDQNNTYGWFVFPGHHLSLPFCDVYGADEVRGISEVFNFIYLKQYQALPVHPKMTYQAHQTPASGLIRIPHSGNGQKILEEVFSKIHVSSVYPTKLKATADFMTADKLHG